MTDFATLVMGAETSGLLKGKDALQQVTAAGAKTEAVVESVSSSFDQAGASARKIAADYKSVINSMTGVTRETQKAIIGAQDYVNSLRRQAASFDQLRASIDPVFAASKRYEAAVEQVNSALKSGIISQAEANRTLALAETAYLGAGNAAVTYAGQARTSSFQTANLAAQFNDIGMMLAAGQSPLMLAVQQGTQVSQVLNMMGGRREILTGLARGFLSIINPVSLATIGIIAAVAALGQWAISAWSARSASRDTADAMDDLAAALSDFEGMSQAAQQSTADLTEKYGEMAAVVRQNFRDLAQLASLRAVDELQRSVQAVGSSVIETIEEFDRLENLSGQSARNATRQIAALEAATGMTAAQARAVRDAFADMINAKGLEDSTRAAQELRDQLLAAYGSLDAMPPAVREIANNAIIAANSGYQLAAAVSDAKVEITGAEVAARNLARINLAQGISPAVAKAMELKSELGVSLQYALRIAGALSFRPMGDVGDPRDPRSNSEEYRLERIRRQMEQITHQHGLIEKAATKATKSGTSGLKELERETRAAEQAAEEYARALNAPLVNAIDSTVDYMLSGFRGGMDGLLDIIKNGIKQAASFLISNPIKIALGVGGVGVSSVTGQAVGAAAGSGSGFLGSLLGGVGGSGGFLSGVGSGLSGVFSGGGLGSSFANLGGLLSGSVGGAGAIGAALPAIGIIVGGIAAIANGLKREYEGSFLRGTFTSEGFSGRTEDFYNGGWLRGDKTDINPVDAQMQALLDSSIGGMTASVRQMAATLDLGTEAITDFSQTIDLRISGKTVEEIQEYIAGQITAAGETMAEMILTTESYTRAGESALDTLTRLSASLTGVNDIMDVLGHRLFSVSLSGADAASGLADLFGGLENMRAAGEVYFQGFYSEAERTQIATRRLTEEFAELGLAMPQSRAAFRALVESVDTSTESGRELYASLMLLSAGMDEVLPQLSAFTASITGLAGNIDAEIQSLIDVSRQNMTNARQMAQLWYRTAETLRDFLRDVLNSDLTSASAGQLLTYNRNAFNQAMSAVRGGDVSAAQDIPDLARAYLESSRASAATGTEYRRIAAAVLGEVNFAAGISELEGANDDILVTLYEKQIEVLTSLGTFLQLEGLTGEQIASLDEGVRDLIENWDSTVGEFEAALDDLSTAIETAQAFSYDDLVARLDVAVALSTDAPAWLRNLVLESAEGIRTTLDFVIRRQDLTPDLRWIAVNSLSEHISTVDFILRNDLDRQSRRLALAATSELRRNIRFILTKDVDAKTRRIALAGNSELSRAVNVSLDRLGSDKRALKLALDNIGAYAVTISGAFEASANGRLIRRLLTNSGPYAAMITATVENLKGNARRILLTRQGEYVANIRGTLESEKNAAIKALLIKDQTKAIRTITLQTLGLGKDQKALIDAIRGGDTLITLAGRFTFTPEEAFSTWYSSTSKALIATPMTKLGNQLDRLRDAIDADRQQREDAANVIRLNAVGQDVAGVLAARQARASNLVTQIEALEARTGVTLKNGAGDAVLKINPDGTIEYKASHVELGGNSNLSAFSDAFWAEGGLQDQIAARNAAVTASSDRLDSLRQQIRALGGVPAFAAGTSFAPGGLAMVGEAGRELINLPRGSRVYSNKQTNQMLDNSELLAELRELRKEVAGLRDENAANQRALTFYTKKIADLEEKADTIGAPPERAEL